MKSLAKTKMYPCTSCTQYVLQKREMILMKCQVVRHNNNNKSFQISSKIPHYYYPSVAKPLTTLKVICQIIFCIMMSPLPVQCNLHADMAFHEKNNSSKQNNLHSTYSRVHKSPPPFFSKILEKPSIVQKKMIPHINGLGFSLI